MVTTTLINRLSRAIDLIEQRSRFGPLKVVKVRRGFDEDPDTAGNRHHAAHPDDRGENTLIIFEFCDDDELADESRDGRA